MRTTRRAYLVGLAGFGGTAALAGCLGGNGGASASGGGKVKKLPQPTLGEKGAPVTVTVFEDYLCPHCATFSLQTFPQIRSEYVDAGKVRYEFYDFPFMGDWSWAAASAARAVQDATDDETFFAYQKKLYENQQRYSYDLVASLAEEVDAGDAEARSAAKNLTYEPVLQKNRKHGENLGVQGTPGVFVDGNSVEPSWEAIRSAIESAL